LKTELGRPELGVDWRLTQQWKPSGQTDQALAGSQEDEAAEQWQVVEQLWKQDVVAEEQDLVERVRL